MRCTTLADYFKKKGFSVVFISRYIDKNSLKLLKQNGHSAYVLKNTKKNNLTQIQDALLTKEILLKQNINFPYLIVDNYTLSKKWETILKKYVYKIIVIDDMANKKHDCDLLINQNYSVQNMIKKYKKILPKKCNILSGTKYAILRPEFLKLRKLIKMRVSLNTILISFGGSDPTNETIKILKAIKNLNLIKIKFIIIAGKLNSNLEKIKKLTSQINNSDFYSHTNKIEKLMMKSDLSFGGGGTTTWERCCLGLPSIISILAVNQKQIVESLSKDNYCINLGQAKKLTVNDYENMISNIEIKKIRKMSSNCKKLVDGKGTNRVINAILSL
tara:strand:+ start:2911 stop:3900 length:990 start_codon:yes stop_codon:yes gene_type:complete